MQKVITAYKNLGETPLECLLRVRVEQGISTEVPMTYAGRLDPMAEGELIILTGEECKNKEKYLGLDKEYEVEVLFGISTDTHDVLGKIDGVGNRQFGEIDLNKYVGKFVQDYPRYSSRIIARIFAKKELPDEMPTKEVEIYSMENLGMREMSGVEVLKQVKEKVALVKGDFRQKEIISIWEQKFSGEFGAEKFPVLKIRVRCSSGTYMRSLASRMGKNEGSVAVALSILRTKILIGEGSPMSQVST